MKIICTKEEMTEIKAAIQSLDSFFLRYKNASYHKNRFQTLKQAILFSEKEITDEQEEK